MSPKKSHIIGKKPRKQASSGTCQQRANFKPKSGRVVYKVLILLREGQYSSSIARLLKMPRTTIDSIVRKLHANGFTKLEIKEGAKFYQLTKRGREFIKDYRCQLSRYGGEQGKTRMHRLNIKFKILKDNPHAKFDSEHEMNNWIQKYTKLTFPIGITLQKNPDSIVAMFHEFETEKNNTFTDFFSHVMRGVYYVYYHLMEHYKIRCDIFDLEVVSQEIANERPDLDGKLDDKKITTLGLTRKAKSFFKTNIDGKAWLDYSKGVPEIETNDLLYEERLLMMPETVQAINDRFVPMIGALTKQVNLHLEVQRGNVKVQKETLKTLQEMRKALKVVYANGKKK